MISKLNQFEFYITEHDPHIISLTETWASEDIPTTEISIEMYTCYRRDRNSKTLTKGGGVMLYIKNELLHTENHNICSKGSVTELMWCDMLTNGNETVIALCHMTVLQIVRRNLENSTEKWA